MQKDKNKRRTSLQPGVIDPEQQTQSKLLGKWTAAPYSNSEEMMELVSGLASGSFKWKIHTSHYFDGAISFAKWDKNCSFEVNIKLDLETSKYIFVVINKKHCNHEVKALAKIKNYVQNLTTEELKRIKHLGVADSGIAAADAAIHRNFPDALFEKDLVRKKMGKAKKVVDTSENNNIKKSNACGKRCIDCG
eukprot:snap_masked-scaffold_6-processed-gene-20.33-mRNA-1 protein AED:1.00 eAED:1.00 QI:0/0/0/0/1/1/2/0/191